MTTMQTAEADPNNVKCGHLEIRSVHSTLLQIFNSLDMLGQNALNPICSGGHRGRRVLVQSVRLIGHVNPLGALYQ